MNEYKISNDTTEKLNKLKQFISNKKTVTFKILNISKLSTIADYFLIVSMDNIRAVESLKDDLIDFCEEHDIEIRNKEGITSPWVLIDLNDIIIHVFTEEMRSFYNLERLWADAEIVD